jgi:hypothetical protein
MMGSAHTHKLLRQATGWEWDRRYVGSPLSPIFLLFIHLYLQSFYFLRIGERIGNLMGVILQRFYNKHNQGKQLA